jgi:hypothetical protein
VVSEVDLDRKAVAGLGDLFVTLHKGAQVHTTEGTARESAELKVDEILCAWNLNRFGFDGYECALTNYAADIDLLHDPPDMQE